MKDIKTEIQEPKRTQSSIKKKKYTQIYHIQTAEKDKKKILKAGRGEKNKTKNKKPSHTKEQRQKVQQPFHQKPPK